MDSYAWANFSFNIRSFPNTKPRNHLADSSVTKVVSYVMEKRKLRVQRRQELRISSIRKLQIIPHTGKASQCQDKNDHYVWNMAYVKKQGQQ